MKLLYKIIYIILMAIASINISMAQGCKNRDHREEVIQANEHLHVNYKTLLLTNTTPNRVICIVNFEFTKDEINNIHPQILLYNNKIDTIFLAAGEATTVVSPIPAISDIVLPEDFYMSIYDSAFNQLYILSADEFLKRVETIRDGRWKFSIND